MAHRLSRIQQYHIAGMRNRDVHWSTLDMSSGDSTSGREAQEVGETP